MTSLTLPPTEVLPIGDVHPYWRNPRRIPREAVEAVASSIRKYGYVQPIVVDREHVVVVGHTRLEAVKQLGWTEVPVYVTDLPASKAAQYRLVDNRTHEYSTWDHEALVLELREFDTGLVREFFPHMQREIEQVAGMAGDVTEADLARAEEDIEQVPAQDAGSLLTTRVVCPACAHEFEVMTRSLGVLDEDELRDLGRMRQAVETGQEAWRSAQT